MQPEQPTTIQRVLESFERSLSLTDSPSSAAVPAAEPGGSDPSADAATIVAAAAAAATPSAATGSDVTTKDYYAFRGETVKLLNHFGTVVTSIQQQQISQAASLTEVSGRLAPENLGSVIAGQLQPALKQFSDIVTKSISAAMNPTAINTMVVAALAAQPPQVSAPAAAPTSSFYSFGPALAPTNPIVQLPGYEVAPTAAPLTLASTSDAEMFLPEEALQTTSLNKFWEESADRQQEVQAFIRNLQADLPNKQAATPTLVMQPPSKSQSIVYHSTHPDIPFVPLVPASPVIGSVIAPATSSVLLPTMTSIANKSKIDQKIATFDKITQTSDVLSWLEDVSLACAITDTAHDKWVLVAGTHMTGAPLRYFKTAYSKARKQGQAALDAFCEWDNFVAWCEKTLNRRDHEKHAFDVLASLQQTGTVSDYTSKFDDFAARVETTVKMLLHWWLQGLQPHVREQCIRDPCTNQPFVLLEDSQDAALAVTSYDDNSTTGVGSLSTSTKKQRTNLGTAQATGYKTAVQQPTRPSPRAHRMQVCGTPQNLLKGIVVGQDPGEYALASYCSGAPPGTAAKMPPQLGKPGSANRCWTSGCNGHNPNSTEPHT
ncbi:TPA: hypothetical protein ACH3X1_013339 [Trebouxia sp. C0004]